MKIPYLPRLLYEAGTFFGGFGFPERSIGEEGSKEIIFSDLQFAFARFYFSA